MDVRTRILEAAADLLAKSVDGDVSTRAVCDAAGVRAPALYRQFGDKKGLLAAVVDFGFEQYLAGKRALKPTGDPVEDLYSGWRNHMAFALAQPNYYRLMYAPGLTTPPAAAAEAHRLLLAVLRRCAAAGKLRIAPEVAAQMVMSANVGVALSLICRPELYPDPSFGDRVRDGIFGAVFVDGATRGATAGPAAASPADAAITLEARLRSTPPAELSAMEAGLLQEWLGRLIEPKPAGSAMSTS